MAAKTEPTTIIPESAGYRWIKKTRRRNGKTQTYRELRGPRGGWCSEVEKEKLLPGRAKWSYFSTDAFRVGAGTLKEAKEEAEREIQARREHQRELRAARVARPAPPKLSNHTVLLDAISDALSNCKEVASYTTDGGHKSGEACVTMKDGEEYLIPVVAR